MKQFYTAYTNEDHHVWSLLFERQIQSLKDKADTEFLNGLELVGFEPHQLPDFRQVNQRLQKLTGLQLQAVPGIVDNATFFNLLANQKFPATTWIRKLSQLNYLEEPDMFHDVFGHVPLLSNKEFCGFLKGLSNIALQAIDDPVHIEKIARIYWYTVEFGLIQKANGSVKIYGAGILSSMGETEYSLSVTPDKFEFEVDKILETPYIKEKYQEQYFIVGSLETLYKSLPEINRALKTELLSI